MHSGLINRPKVFKGLKEIPVSNRNQLCYMLHPWWGLFLDAMMLLKSVFHRKKKASNFLLVPDAKYDLVLKKKHQQLTYHGPLSLTVK